MIRDVYDVIVVGGGPGGTVAARYAAEGGASVLLLEKDRDLGIPVRCAEAIGKDGYDGFLSVKPQWVALKLRGLRFVAPDGTNFDIPNMNEIGYILNRRLFDQELGRMAVSAGAKLLTRAYVNGLLTEAGQVEGVRVKFPDTEKEISAKIIIGADGVESRVGRWAGIRTDFSPKDFETCYQMTLGGIDVDTTCVTLHFGSEVAPGGYAWVFPKSDNTANVGLGVNAAKTGGVSAQERLEKFIDRNYPQASVLACVAGGVPAAKPLKKIHGMGIMLVGDAAAHSNALSGGGISNAMAAGKLAGEIAARCIKNGTWDEKALSEYTREWDKKWGDELRRFYRIKETVYKLDDDILNKGAHVLARIPPEKRTLRKVVSATLMNHPKLLLDIARSFL